MKAETIFKELGLLCAEVSRDVEEIVKDAQEHRAPLDFKVVPLLSLMAFVERMERDEHDEVEREKAARPIEKFLFIEDGSVNADELINDLALKNPEIKVVVFRQGSTPPQLIESFKGD